MKLLRLNVRKKATYLGGRNHTPPGQNLTWNHDTEQYEFKLLLYDPAKNLTFEIVGNQIEWDQVAEAARLSFEEATA